MRCQLCNSDIHFSERPDGLMACFCVHFPECSYNYTITKDLLFELLDKKKSEKISTKKLFRLLVKCFEDSEIWSSVVDGKMELSFRSDYETVKMWFEFPKSFLEERDENTG